MDLWKREHKQAVSCQWFGSVSTPMQRVPCTCGTGSSKLGTYIIHGRELGGGMQVLGAALMGGKLMRSGRRCTAYNTNQITRPLPTKPNRHDTKPSLVIAI